MVSSITIQKPSIQFHSAEICEQTQFSIHNYLVNQHHSANAHNLIQLTALRLGSLELGKIIVCSQPEAIVLLNRGHQVTVAHTPE